MKEFTKMGIVDGINEGWDAIVWWERFAGHKQMGDIVNFWTYYPAWLFAMEVHDGTFRDSGEQFRNHAWRVSIEAAENNGSMIQILDSYFHDCGDMGLLTPERLYEEFKNKGRVDAEKIINHFKALTFKSDGYKSPLEKELVKTEAKLEAISSYPELALVIGADRLDNLRDLQYMKGTENEEALERQIRKLNSTWRIAEEIESRYPKLYATISKQLTKNRERINLEIENQRTSRVYVPAPSVGKVKI